jgi:hypothetical protein
MVQPSRRSALVGLAALGVAVTAGGAAHARVPQGTGASRTTLHVVTGEDGFSAPSTAAAGAVAVRLHTTSTSTGAVGLARLRRGVSEAEFRNRLRRVFATDGRENIEAAKALMAAAELYGGGFTHVGTDTGYTVELDAGAYLLLEFLDFEGERGRDPAPGQEYVRRLTVRETRSTPSPTTRSPRRTSRRSSTTPRLRRRSTSPASSARHLCPPGGPSPSRRRSPPAGTRQSPGLPASVMHGPCPRTANTASSPWGERFRSAHHCAASGASTVNVTNSTSASEGRPG